MYILDFSRLVSWWATSLCLALLRPSRDLLLHRKSKCGQSSLSLIWHTVEVGLVCAWP